MPFDLAILRLKLCLADLLVSLASRLRGDLPIREKKPFAEELTAQRRRILLRRIRSRLDRRDRRGNELSED